MLLSLFLLLSSSNEDMCTCREFFWTLFSQNLTSKKIISCGCLKQSKGEYKIEQLLKENNINYQT